MNAHSELDLALGRQARVPLDHAILHFDGAPNGIHDAPELDERTVAGAFDDAATMNRDGGIDKVAAQASEPRQGPILIGAGKSAIAHHIGG